MASGSTQKRRDRTRHHPFERAYIENQSVEPDVHAGQHHFGTERCHQSATPHASSAGPATGQSGKRPFVADRAVMSTAADILRYGSVQREIRYAQRSPGETRLHHLWPYDLSTIYR